MFLVERVVDVDEVDGGAVESLRVGVGGEERADELEGVDEVGEKRIWIDAFVSG